MVLAFGHVDLSVGVGRPSALSLPRASTPLSSSWPRRAGTRAPPSVQLEELTWTEVGGAAVRHDHHHHAGRRHRAERAAHGARQAQRPRPRARRPDRRRLGDTLVAPVLAYVPEGAISPPAGHMRFPGTISIPDAAFKSLLEAAARSFRQAGFTHIVLLGDHGGYQALLKQAAADLNREWAGHGVRAHFIAEYYRATPDAPMCRRCARRASATRRSAAMPAWPTPR